MNYTVRQVRDFWSKVAVGATEDCWLWTAAVVNSGYGVKRVTRNGKNAMALAHRMAWEIFNSDIPEGLVVCHKCDNKRCCNPAHLFLGTHKDNTQDMIAKKRGNVPMLTAEQVGEIRSMRESGLSVRAIALQMGISTFPVMRAIHGRGPYAKDQN